MTDPLFARIHAMGIIPVAVIEQVSYADTCADALVSGGLPLIEVTFRTNGAASIVRAMAKRGDMLVGAGTVLTVEQVQEAVDAGATFIVSPGFSANVVRECQRLGIPVIPGAVTATEIQAAIDMGVTIVKFFPAETSGGLPAIQALAAPFRNTRFIPTGGITAGSAPAYLAEPAVWALGGSWLLPANLMCEGDVAGIAERVRQARALVEHVRPA